MGAISAAAVGAAVGITACGGGTISKGDASATLSSKFSSVPAGIDKAGLINCVASGIFDSGRFNSDEQQSILTANATEVGSSLSSQFVTGVVSPCVSSFSTAQTRCGVACYTPTGQRRGTPRSSLSRLRSRGG